jgi:hypothetical protein
MTQLQRKNNKVFCGNVTYQQNIANFGSLASNSPSYSNDPDTIQNEDWLAGWTDALISSNFPTIQDMNAAYYVLTRNISQQFQDGYVPYSSLITYEQYDIVWDGDSLFMSLASANLGYPLTNSAKWKMIFSTKITDVGTANYTALNTDYHIRWSLGDTSGSSKYIILPTPSANLKGRTYIISNISGSSSPYVNVKANDNSTIGAYSTDSASLVIPHISAGSYHSRIAICDGSKWILHLYS